MIRVMQAVGREPAEVITEQCGQIMKFEAQALYALNLLGEFDSDSGVCC